VIKVKGETNLVRGRKDGKIAKLPVLKGKGTLEGQARKKPEKGKTRKASFNHQGKTDGNRMGFSFWCRGGRPKGEFVEKTQPKEDAVGTFLSSTSEIFPGSN